MKKILIFGALAAATIAPFALAGSASAATVGAGTYDYVTSYAGQLYPHQGTTQYTCNTDGSIGFTFQGDETAGIGDGHGTGVINGPVFVMTGSRASDGYGYSFSGDLASNGSWTLTGQSDSVGDTGVHAAGNLLGIPNCTVDPIAPTGNHGEYVSGAAHAGIKGKALAAIAQDNTLVGPYTGSTAK